MKLELVNFKCHDFKEFEFTENNVILISGKSGVGKTSIIEAFVFVLFGTGRKITKYGQKSCSVRLQISLFDKSYIIKRTKGPNRLTLDYTDQTTSELNINHYEDAAAQGIINELFGQQYESVGYLSQSSINSFVLMGPQEKLSFLENLIFKSSELKETKQKIQNLIKERTQLLQTTVGKADMLSQIIKDAESTYELIDPEFPIKKKSGAIITSEQEQLLVEKNTQTEITNAIKRTEQVDKKLIKLNKMLEEREAEKHVQDQCVKKYDNFLTCMSIFEDQYIDSKLEKIDAPENKIQQYANIINDMYSTISSEYDENAKKIANIKQFQEYHLTSNSLDEKRQKYDQIYQNEKDVLTHDLEDIEIKTDNEIDEYKLEIKENNEFCDVFKKYREYCTERTQAISSIKLDISECIDILGINNYDADFDNIGSINKVLTKYQDLFKQKIEQYENDIESLLEDLQKIKLEEQHYTCPQCNAKLMLNIKSTTLTIAETVETVDTVESIEKKISKRRKKTTKLKKHDANLSRIVSNIKILDKKIAVLEKEYDADDLKMDNTEIDKIMKRNEYLHEVITKNVHNESKQKTLKQKLKHSTLDSHILNELYQDIKKLEHKKAKLYDRNKLANDSDIIDYDESTLSILTETNISHAIELNKYKAAKKMLEDLEDTLNEYNKQKAMYEKEYNQPGEKKLTLMSIKKHIESNTLEKEKYSNAKQENIRLQHNIEKWKIKHTQYKNHIQQKTDLINLLSTIDDLRCKLQSIYKLKEFVKIAETTLLERILKQINQYVANYLDIFFQTDPITIRLYVKDDDKSTSRNGQLYLSVDYKGMDDADLGILSGGELQRVVIAYNLALSEIFCVPMILLDECTSNLDSQWSLK